VGAAYKPSPERELRAQGRRTQRRLLDAGLAVFAARGYHAARVDDVVRAAKTSHGTFYLYFASKEDLLGALAVECAEEYEALAGEPDLDLRTFVGRFFGAYRRFGPVIRAWMEHGVTDRAINRLGVAAFTHVADALGARLAAAGVAHDPATVGVLMALLERSAYYAVAADRPDTDLATVVQIVERGFFTAA
jgi:AcrR family transcriptional regulator